MAHSLWRRALAAAANIKLPDQEQQDVAEEVIEQPAGVEKIVAVISPIVHRIGRLLDDPTSWTHEDEKKCNRYSILTIKGPCDIQIAELSYSSFPSRTTLIVKVNEERLDLSDVDREWLQKRVDEWRDYDRRVRQFAADDEKREREIRIWKHLDECLCV